MARLPCGALAQGGFGSARNWLIRPVVGVCHQAARVAKTAPSRRGGSWHHWWRHLWHHSLRYLCARVQHRQPQLALGNRAEATRRGRTQPSPAVTPQYTHAPLGAMVWGPPASSTCGDCPLAPSPPTAKRGGPSHSLEKMPTIVPPVAATTATARTCAQRSTTCEGTWCKDSARTRSAPPWFMRVPPRRVEYSSQRNSTASRAGKRRRVARAKACHTSRRHLAGLGEVAVD